MKLSLPIEWQELLADELQKSYYKKILQFLAESRERGILIYPKEEHIFAAFEHTSVANTKVVILGQDPYHGPGQAHGLSFSVPPGVKLPPSLVNIFKELRNDLGFEIPMFGDLTKWANQGVLLLNTALTVEARKANSHAKIGWQLFTDAVIKNLSASKEHLVFVLWGAHAQKKQVLIDASKHLILQSAHPSPLSAHNGFWGNKHFSTINYFLLNHNLAPIDWQLI
jgi:uracil-DNA glycosylase